MEGNLAVGGPLYTYEMDGKFACMLSVKKYQYSSLYTHFRHFYSVVGGKVQEVIVISLQMPCRLYYCCHDYGGKNVNIYVAIGTGW